MMDQESSEPTTISTIVYDSDGSVVMKQEPQSDFSQIDVKDDCDFNSNVINIAPIIDNKTGIPKTEDFHLIKQEPHSTWCELSENYQPAVNHETGKSGNDLHVCDGNQDSKLLNTDVSLKTEIVRTDDSSSQLVEVSGVVDSKDDISSNVTARISIGRVNQSDAVQQQPLCHLERTEEIKRAGM